MNLTKSTRGAATRNRVLEVAREVLANEGLEAFALRDIAKRAGMQLGNLQYYFPAREDLIEAVIRAESASNVEIMNELMEGARDLEDYMKQLAQLMIREYNSMGGKVWPILRLLRTHSERFRDISRVIYQEHFDALVAGMIRFGVPGTKRELMDKARVITALVDGAALQAHLWANPRNSEAWTSLCRRTSDIAAAVAAE
jgi:AcrR family transcriptional regulator